MFGNFDKYKTVIDKGNINENRLFGVMVNNNRILDLTLLLSIENKMNYYVTLCGLGMADALKRPVKVIKRKCIYQ